MKQITPLLHIWSQYHAAERLDRNGYFAQRAAGEPGALVDPVALHPGDQEELRELGGVAAVVLTNGDAARAQEAVALRQALDCPVYAPAAVHEALDRAGLSGLHSIKDWEALPGGLLPQTLTAADGSPATTLLHRPSRAWLVGDLVVGVPAGMLGLPESVEGEAVQARAVRSLRGLLSVMFDRVLVARGTPVLREGVAAVQDLVFRHDPEACVMRPSEAVFIPGNQHGTSYGRSGAEYARLLGLNTLDFDLQEVLPGRRSTAVHRHDGDEECFVVLAGEGELHILRPGEKELRRIPIAAGDVVGFPPRYQIAHSFKCTGTEPLRFLAFSAPGKESVGVIDYPLSGKRLTYAWPPGKLYRYFLPDRRDVPYFENEPED